MGASAFYREQAQRAEQEAAVAELPNVRGRHLNAARTWSEMAGRAERTEELSRQRQEAAASRKGV